MENTKSEAQSTCITTLKILHIFILRLHDKISEISHAKIVNQFSLVLSCHNSIEYWSYRSSLEASSSF